MLAGEQLGTNGAGFPDQSDKPRLPRIASAADGRYFRWRVLNLFSGLNGAGSACTDREPMQVNVGNADDAQLSFWMPEDQLGKMASFMVRSAKLGVTGMLRTQEASCNSHFWLLYN